MQQRMAAAMMRKRAAAKANKDVDLDALVATGPTGAYEALQLYRSRAIKKKTKGEFMGAVKVLADGACCLLKHTFTTAGAELATLLVEMVDEEHKDLDADLRSTLYAVDDSFDPKSPQKVEFLKGCVKWTVSSGSRENGDPAFHVRLANCLWANGDTKNAYSHFAAGEAPEELVQRLEDTYPNSNQLEPKVRGLTLGVLHFLALENLRDANDLMDNFNRRQKAKGGKPPKAELLTFLDYLLQTCRRDAQPLFKTLVTKYASDLDFDETAPALLMGPIGQRLFGIAPKVNPMMSMLQNMLN